MAQDLNGLVLDCMMGRTSSRSTIDTRFRAGKTSVAGRAQPSLWAGESLRAASPAIKEAFIVSAVLYVESNLGVGADSVLSKPFPAFDRVRYPAMFLDDQFLERRSKTFDHTAMATLTTLIADVPPSLLHRLIQKLFQSFAVQRPSDYGRVQHTFELIKLLARSDRPSTALDLVKEVVLARPDDSGWHRQILGRGLINRLSAGTSQRFIRTLASDIQEMLKHQVSAALQAGDVDMQPLKSTVKVSTVKMVAQIMTDLQSMPEADIVESLDGLLIHVRHLDIRAAVVDSLISRLLETKSNAIELEVISILRQHAMPVAASMNERHPLSESEWQEAEAKCAVPEIYIGNDAYEVPPILAALLTPCGSRWDSLGSIRQQYLDEVILPLLQISATNTRRWLNVFVRSVGLDLDLSALPLVPSRIRVFNALLVPCVDWLPRAWYQIAWDWVIVNLDKPQCVLEVLDAVEHNEKARRTDAWKYFESLWNQWGLLVYDRTSLGTAGLLKKRWQSQRPDGITYVDVQRQVLREARTIVDAASGGVEAIRLATGAWMTFKSSLLRPQIHEHDAVTCWHEFCRPVIEEIIYLIDSLRTAEWQKDPHRHPALLPETFTMRLWLLPYIRDPTDASAIRASALAISGVVEELAASTRPYATKFAQLEDAVKAGYSSCFISLATEIWFKPGLDGDKPTLAVLLRLELSHKLLCRAPQPKGDFEKARVLALLQSWAASVDEDVRTAARSTSRKQGHGRGEQRCEWLEQLVLSGIN